MSKLNVIKWSKITVNLSMKLTDFILQSDFL